MANAPRTLWTLRSAALSACCACAAGAKFEFAAEAQALTHHYIKSSGLEDLSYFSFISLAIVVLGGAVLSVLLDWQVAPRRAKKRTFVHTLELVLLLLVVTQYYHIFFASVRLSRHGVRAERWMKECPLSSKGGKQPQAAIASHGQNPCCQGRPNPGGGRQADLKCEVRGKNEVRLCRECATKADISAGRAPFFCRSEYASVGNPKYCDLTNVASWGDDHSCISRLSGTHDPDWVCTSGCPMTTLEGFQGDWVACFTKALVSDPTTGVVQGSGDWQEVARLLDDTRDCHNSEGAYCTKAEPCTPCEVAKQHALGFPKVNPATELDLLDGRCATCASEWDGNCNFVEGLGPYCRKGTTDDIEPCGRCCSEQPVYPFASTNYTCV